MARLQNAERFRAWLRNCPANVHKQLHDDLDKGAYLIVDEQRHLAPLLKHKRAGRLRGALQKSIDYVFGSAPLGSLFSSRISSDTPDDLRVTIFAGAWGAMKDAFYARWVEFGTKAGVKGGRTPDARADGRRTRRVYRTHPGTKAQPYFFPPFRRLKGRALAGLVRGFKKSLRIGFGS